MRKSGPRFFGFGVPLACLVATACGLAEPALHLFLAYSMICIASLFAPEAFSRAAAKLLNLRKVTGSLLIAILLILIPASAIYLVCRPPIERLSNLMQIGACAFLVIIRCFEELFNSQGDRTSAQITMLLTAIGLSAHFLLAAAPYDYSSYPNDIALIAVCGAILLISGLIAIGFSKKCKPQLSLAIFKEIPAAFVRTALYPALFIGIHALRIFIAWPFARETAIFEQRTLLLCGFYAGMILTAIAKSTFRRTREESTGLKTGLAMTALIVGAAPLAIGSFWWNMDLLSLTAAIFIAAAAALLLYSSADWETFTAAAVLLVAAALIEFGITPPENSFPNEIFIGPAAGILTCALMFNQWRELIRLQKVKKIRKNALKRAKKPSF